MKKYMLTLVSFLALANVAKADTGFDTWDTNFSNKTEQSERPERNFERKSKKSSTETVSYSGGETGLASYYWQPQAVACGGRLNPNALTAAHRTLPCGSRVTVTNLHNKKSVTVTINDRGPFVSGRVIDLSKAAAVAINMTGSGIVPVSLSKH
jgi:rare lipoprotein A